MPVFCDVTSHYWGVVPNIGKGCTAFISKGQVAQDLKLKYEGNTFLQNTWNHSSNDEASIPVKPASSK
jgi:hypothetical protein